MTDFNASQIFNLSGFPFADIFSNREFVWQVLPEIKTYIQSLFDEQKIEPNYKNRKDVFIGKGTEIHESVEIIGPAIVGENCTISHAAQLRDGCILGNNVHVGHAVEIKHSILLNKAVVAHLNYIGDSIIGSEVNIAGGTMVANFRLDKKLISIRDGEHKIDTGLQKFGSVIGDGGNIGANCVINPGTILGKNITVFPLLSVKGVHKEGETIR